MNFRIQFMTSIVLCLAHFTFGNPADQSMCNVSLEPASPDTPVPSTWPAESSPGYICGSSKDKNPAVEYHQCRTCNPTAVGMKCRLTGARKSPELRSIACTDAYGPMNVLLTGDQVHYCDEGNHGYTCLKIAHPTVCDECVAYRPNVY